MSDSDKLVKAWAKAYLADGDTTAKVEDVTVTEDYRTVNGTGCDTCGYGGESEPYAVNITGTVNGEYEYKTFEGTMGALIDIIQQFKVMQAAGLMFADNHDEGGR